jgi:hypothetical protein
MDGEQSHEYIILSLMLISSMRVWSHTHVRVCRCGMQAGIKTRSPTFNFFPDVLIPLCGRTDATVRISTDLRLKTEPKDLVVAHLTVSRSRDWELQVVGKSQGTSMKAFRPQCQEVDMSSNEASGMVWEKWSLGTRAQMEK